MKIFLVNYIHLFHDQLGDDPTESQALQMTVRPDILKRWEYFCKEGLKREEYDALIKKYDCLKDLQAPKLNEL